MSETKHSHFSEAYYRARKSLALWSGLLLAWELIGFKVCAQPVKSFNVELLNPKSVPIVLLVLCFFYIYKVFFQWNLEETELREKRAAKLDFWPSVVIGVFAIIYSIGKSLKGEEFLSFNTSNSIFYDSSLTASLILFIICWMIIFLNGYTYVSAFIYSKCQKYSIYWRWGIVIFVVIVEVSIFWSSINFDYPLLISFDYIIAIAAFFDIKYYYSSRSI